MSVQLLPSHPGTQHLPVHPRTGLCAVGIVAGRPVWPIRGGAGEGNEGQGGSQQSSGTGQAQQNAGGGTSQEGGQQTGGQQNGGQQGNNAGQQGNAQQQSGGSGQQQSVDQLPEWAQKLIRETRDEAASNRTAKTAAENAQQATLDKIATALGLKNDDSKDPDKLAADLTAARDQARQKDVELAVFRAAGQHGGDPVALLDSRSFLANVRDLDPSHKDFTAQVAAKIQDAVKDNPRLKTAAEQSGGQQRPAGGGRSMGQGRQGQQGAGLTGVEAGRALRRERKRPRTQDQRT